MFLWRQDFSLFFGVKKFNYMSWCKFLCIYVIWGCSTSWICRFMVFCPVWDVFRHYVFNTFWLNPPSLLLWVGPNDMNIISCYGPTDPYGSLFFPSPQSTFSLLLRLGWFLLYPQAHWFNPLSFLLCYWAHPVSFYFGYCIFRFFNFHFFLLHFSVELSYFFISMKRINNFFLKYFYDWLL